MWRGIEDGSIRELLVKETAQILMSLVVGANRTRVLTPYAPPHLYREAVAFAARAITPCNACDSTWIGFLPASSWGLCRD